MLKSLVKKVTQTFQTRRRSTLTGKISPGEVYMDKEKLRMAKFMTQTDLSDSTCLGEDRDKNLRKTPPKAKKKVAKMYVMSVTKFIQLYGGLKSPKIQDFETLLKDGYLVEWCEIPANSTTIFVSHEWTGNRHADPSGTQVRHLAQVLKRLRSGKIERVETETSHLTYGLNRTTDREEWSRLLSKSYIWFDWFSVQCKHSEDVIRSIWTFVSRCDMMLVLAPSCEHSDRMDPLTNKKSRLSYRTFRLRAMCVYEMYVPMSIIPHSFMNTHLQKHQYRYGHMLSSQEHAQTSVLLVRSGIREPSWISAWDFNMISIGSSVFQCCETNHEIISECYRSILREELWELVEKRAEALFTRQCLLEARLTASMKPFFSRDFQRPPEEVEIRYASPLHRFMEKILKWDWEFDGEWFDRHGYSILIYAVLYGDYDIVYAVLDNETRVRFENSSHENTKSQIELCTGTEPKTNKENALKNTE